MSNESVFLALDIKTERIVHQKHLPIGRAIGGHKSNHYASVALGGKQLFLANDQGGHLVLAPGKTYTEFARNSLEEGSGAIHAFDDKVLFLRGCEKLYCVGAEVSREPRLSEPQALNACCEDRLWCDTGERGPRIEVRIMRRLG